MRGAAPSDACRGRGPAAPPRRPRPSSRQSTFFFTTFCSFFRFFFLFLQGAAACVPDAVVYVEVLEAACEPATVSARFVIESAKPRVKALSRRFPHPVLLREYSGKGSRVSSRRLHVARVVRALGSSPKSLDARWRLQVLSARSSEKGAHDALVTGKGDWSSVQGPASVAGPQKNRLSLLRGKKKGKDQVSKKRGAPKAVSDARFSHKAHKVCSSVRPSRVVRRAPSRVKRVNKRGLST